MNQTQESSIVPLELSSLCLFIMMSVLHNSHLLNSLSSVFSANTGLCNTTDEWPLHQIATPLHMGLLVLYKIGHAEHHLVA